MASRLTVSLWMQRSDTALLHPQIAAKLEIPGSQRWKRFIASIGLENDGLQKPLHCSTWTDCLVLVEIAEKLAVRRSLPFHCNLRSLLAAT